MRAVRLVAVAVLGLVALLGGGCVPPTVSSPTGNDGTATPTNEQTAGGDVPLGAEGFETAGGNFAVLVSDQENVIGDFAHLWVDITKIGVQVRGEEERWLEFDVPVEYQQVDLKELTGENASALVQTSLPPGDYGKIFVYIDDVEGELLSGETVPVKLPSSKLQLNQPFTVGGDEVTTFVFDITVLAAGNERSGVRYLLNPSVDESGPDKAYRVPERLRIRQRLELVTEDLDGDGRPDIVAVRDQDGNPVRDSKVQIEVRLGRLKTDVNGEVTFVVPSRATEIKAHASNGDAEAEVQFFVGVDTDEAARSSSNGLTIEIAGEPVAGQRLTLRVVDANGSPVEGAVVAIGAELDGGETGEDGTLQFEAPIDGEIEIEARTRGARGDSVKTRAIERIAEARGEANGLTDEQRRRLEERGQKLGEQRRALAARADQAKNALAESRRARLAELENKDQDNRELTDEESLRLEVLRRKEQARLSEVANEQEGQRREELRKLEEESRRRTLTAAEREKIEEMRRLELARKGQAESDEKRKRIEELRLLEVRSRILTLRDDERTKLEELRRLEALRVGQEKRDLERKTDANLTEEEKLRLMALRETEEKRSLEERERDSKLSDAERRKLAALRDAENRRALVARWVAERLNLEEREQLRTITEEERRRLQELRKLEAEQRAEEQKRLAEERAAKEEAASARESDASRDALDDDSDDDGIKDGDETGRDPDVRTAETSDAAVTANQA